MKQPDQAARGGQAGRRAGAPLGCLRVVSLGPGSLGLLTLAAQRALAECDVVMGYSVYIEHIRELVQGKQLIFFDMGEERQRAEAAVRLAEEGTKVALVSGGDAGVYGMAGLVFEYLATQDWSPDSGVPVEVVPGVTAATAAAAQVGAPLAADFAIISLSDRYIPWGTILRRIEAAAWADMVIVIYEPASRHRPHHIAEAQEVIARYRAPDTPVAVVRDAFRPGQEVVLTSVGEMLRYPLDMRSLVIIGNSTTRVHRGVLVTPRCYPAETPSSP